MSFCCTKTLKQAKDRLVICEGELDRLLLLSKGVSAVTSTHGAMTFKKEWCAKIPKDLKIYLCFDNDITGKKAAERIAKMLGKNGHQQLYIVSLPKDVGEGGDVTDYFMKLNGRAEDLFETLSKPYPEKIDTSQFQPLTLETLSDVLGLTIKKDDVNKVVTFLCELSAYTENAQFNISFNAPSSTGKSYIPTEIARLFPEEDVIEVGYCSPTAFFHDVGEYNKERGGYEVDLSCKILIFLDQPHTQLLERLRPLLSHDKKEICLKITDKTQKFGLKTKSVFLKGYPSVIFCTAGLKIDEQEATRFLLLSPEVNQEKIRQGIDETVRKESDFSLYSAWLSENPERNLLKERIRAIKQENIREIKIDVQEKMKERFLKQHRVLKPRHQRDIKRLVSLVKAFALLNLWWRERKETSVTANEDDMEEAFKIWDSLSVSQELNLPPYIYNLYQDVIVTAWNEKNKQSGEMLGLTRQEILQKHFKIYGRMLDGCQMRQQILPMLETAGLILQEHDPKDRRKVLIFPVSPLTFFGNGGKCENGGSVTFVERKKLL